MAFIPVRFSGAETGGIEEWTSTGTGLSVQSSVVRTGSYAYAFAPQSSSTQSQIGLNQVGVNYERVYGFAFRYTGTPAANKAEQIFSALSTTDALIYAVTDGSSNLTLRIRDNQTNQNEADGTTQLAADTWYFIELYKGDNTDALTLYINNAEEADITSPVINDGSFPVFHTLTTGGLNVTWYMDDFYYGRVVDNTERLGDAEVYAHLSNNTGAAADYYGTGSGNLDAGVWTNTADYSESTVATFSSDPGNGVDAVPINSNIDNVVHGVLLYSYLYRGNGGGSTHFQEIGKATAETGGTETIYTNNVTPDTAPALFVYLATAGLVPAPGVTPYICMGFGVSGARDIHCNWQVAMALHQPTTVQTLEGALSLDIELDNAQGALATAYDDLSLDIDLAQSHDTDAVMLTALALVHNLAEAQAGGLGLEADISLDHSLAQSQITTLLLEAALPLDHNLAQVQGSQAVMIASLALDHSLSQLQTPAAVATAALVLSHNLSQAQSTAIVTTAAIAYAIQQTAVNTGGLSLQAAIALAISLDTTNAAQVAFGAALALGHSLTAGITAQMVSEAALALGIDFEQTSITDAVMLAAASLGITLTQAQVAETAGAIEAALSLGVILRGPEGTLSNELNPDSGFDQPTYWN